jgi:hypothetical protein
MSVPDKDWSIVKPVPLTKERVRLACLEETIKQLPRIEHRMKEIVDGLVEKTDLRKEFVGSPLAVMNMFVNKYNQEYEDLHQEYEQAMEAKRDMAERASQQLAEYIHAQATLEFYSNLK